ILQIMALSGVARDVYFQSMIKESSTLREIEGNFYYSVKKFIDTVEASAEEAPNEVEWVLVLHDCTMRDLNLCLKVVGTLKYSSGFFDTSRMWIMCAAGVEHLIKEYKRLAWNSVDLRLPTEHYVSNLKGKYNL